MSILADRINLLKGGSVSVFRCDTDGGLVLGTQSSLSVHAGHHVKAPVMLRLHEMLGVWLGVIK